MSYIIHRFTICHVKGLFIEKSRSFCRSLSALWSIYHHCFFTRMFTVAVDGSFFGGGGSSEVSDKLVDMMEGWAAKERETYLSRNAETKSELKGLWMLETQALTKPGIKAKKWSISLHVTNWKHASSCILIFLTQHCSLQFHLLRARDRKAFFGAFCKCLV